MDEGIIRAVERGWLDLDLLLHLSLTVQNATFLNISTLLLAI
jgi:hypothetical protein